MRYEFMKKHFKEFDVEKMAKVLKVSRSGYYAFIRRPESIRSKDNRRLTDKIMNLHNASRQTYGSPRIHAELKSRGEYCSRKRVARLMRKSNICAKMCKKRKKFSYMTSKDASLIAPNHLQQQFTAASQNKVWVSDITYIPTKEGWLYLCAFIDIYSRKVVGLSMSSRMDTTLISRALQQAIMHRKPSKGLMHHSDRGSQYTSTDFKALAFSNDIKLSMSGKGCCYDNAVAESFFHTLKTEHVNFCSFKTREEGVNSLFEYVEVFYNRERRHSTLGYLSPVEFEEMNERKYECVSAV